MKKASIFILISISFGTITNAQTTVEKKTTDGSSVLDFASGTTKGIILPAVETLPATPANGTFLLDKNDKKVKMYQNGAWVSLSEEGNITNLVPYGGADTANRTVMGSRTSTADGVLVLESPDKAMILPKVASPHLNVKSPYPGMMCYDTDKKALAVFDGSVWNYWK